MNWEVWKKQNHLFFRTFSKMHTISVVTEIMTELTFFLHHAIKHLGNNFPRNFSVHLFRS